MESLRLTLVISSDLSDIIIISSSADYVSCMCKISLAHAIYTHDLVYAGRNYIVCLCSDIICPYLYFEARSVAIRCANYL